LLLSWLVNLCCRKKKKKIDKPHNAMQYYNDTSGFQGNCDLISIDCVMS
jgi:hypothetical protein